MGFSAYFLAPLLRQNFAGFDLILLPADQDIDKSATCLQPIRLTDNFIPPVPPLLSPSQLSSVGVVMGLCVDLMVTRLL